MQKASSTQDAPFRIAAAAKSSTLDSTKSTFTRLETIDCAKPFLAQPFNVLHRAITFTIFYSPLLHVACLSQINHHTSSITRHNPTPLVLILTKIAFEPASDSNVSPHQYQHFTCMILKRNTHGPFFTTIQPSLSLCSLLSNYIRDLPFIDPATSYHHLIKKARFPCSYPSDRSEDPPSFSRSCDANAETRSSGTFLYAYSCPIASMMWCDYRELLGQWCHL